MNRQVVPAYSEDGVWIARGFWALVATVLLLFLFNPFGWNEAEPSSHVVPRAARCSEAPEKYGGRIFCANEETGVHGYVNPGSMEWEVE